jgi:hypothetical protein
MAEKKKEIKPRTSVSGESYMSPSAKKIAADLDAGKITNEEAIDRLGGKGKPQEVRRALARSLGTQMAGKFMAEARNEASNNYSDKTQTRKPGYAKGGMVTKANCGASMKPTQKKAK